jgi:hypothetical protein
LTELMLVGVMVQSPLKEKRGVTTLA